MSALQRPLCFTLEEYFALECASERRFEFRDGEIVCMSGGSREHGRLSSNVHALLAARLAGRGCMAYTSDTALYVPAAPPYRYPDASVVCGEEQFREINGLDALENPILIVEVLSPSSADFDRGTKFESYKSIPTFAEYLLVAQDRTHVARRTKQSDGSWIETVFEANEETVQLASIGIDLPMGEIYEGLAFDQPA
jgi:Uma2 family endonuclease